MIDYVHVKKCFGTSILDTHVYRSTLQESDHEHIVSTLHFKIKVKRTQSRYMHYQTITLPSSGKASYQSILAESLDNSDQTSTINTVWETFKFSILKACESLTSAPQISDRDWITDEVHNLSRKKQEAFVCLKNTPSIDVSHFKKVAAEKACKSWLSDRATESERRAFVTEQQGRRGSLIGDFHLLKNKFSKPDSSALVAKDSISLKSDSDKLNRWAEQFEEVMNCQVDIDVVPCEDIHVVSPLFVSSDTLMSGEDISAPLSEEETVTDIFELRSGKAPGLDGITLEMLSLGGRDTIRWTKSIFDTIWENESVQRLKKSTSRAIAQERKLNHLRQLPWNCSTQHTRQGVC